MDIIVDVVLCAIVLIGFIVGIKCGFVKMLSKPIRFIVALVLAFSFCAPVGAALFAPMISPHITGYIADALNKSEVIITAENALEELPTLIKLCAKVAGINLEELVAGMSGAELIDAVVTELTAPVVHIISAVISFILIFIVSKLVIWLLVIIIDKICSRGLLGVVNKIFGCVLATLLAVIIAWGVAAIVDVVVALPALEGNEFVGSFKGGFVYTFFHTYNPIELLLSF